MKVAVVGATGYGGVELLRWLQRHPEMELAGVYAHSQSDRDWLEVYPHVMGEIQLPLEAVDAKSIAERASLVFTATPSGVSSQLIPQLLEHGVPCVIDLSGDFRLIDPEVYRAWYKKEPAPLEQLQKAVYGLCEVNRAKLRGASLVANPGCYPTATLLGLAPLLQEKWIRPNTIVVDAKSGVSGAGRSSHLAHSFSEANENLKVYKVGDHQHTPEIESCAGEIFGGDVQVTFTTHLIPMTRGIMSTIYAEPSCPVHTEQLLELYREYYGDAPFVRVRPAGNWPQTKEVYGSNFCDIGLHLDERTQRIRVVSVIDNLVKGAAGQAVQNANLLMGWPETLGLTGMPVYP